MLHVYTTKKGHGVKEECLDEAITYVPRHVVCNWYHCPSMQIAEECVERLRWMNEPFLLLELTLSIPYHTFSHRVIPSYEDNVVVTFDPLSIPPEIGSKLDPWFVVDSDTETVVKRSKEVSAAWEKFITKGIAVPFRFQLAKTAFHIWTSAAEASKADGACFGEIALPMLEEMISQYPYASVFQQLKQHMMEDIERWYAPGGKGYQKSLAEFEMCRQG